MGDGAEERLRAARDAPAQARRAARRGHRAVPARLPGRAADRGGQGAARGPRAGRGDRRARARRRPAGRAPRAGQGGVPRPRRPLRAHPAARARRRARRGARWRGCSRSTSATCIGADGTRVPHAPRRAVAARSTTSRCSPSRCGRRPEKHHGLADVETRFRHRELDLMANEETRELFITRAKVIAAIRRFLDDEGFVEVETPDAAADLRRRARRGRSRRTTTRSTATSTCASPPSSTSSG